MSFIGALQAVSHHSEIIDLFLQTGTIVASIGDKSPLIAWGNSYDWAQEVGIKGYFKVWGNWSSSAFKGYMDNLDIAVENCTNSSSLYQAILYGFKNCIK